jgi:hypothetical protein
MRLRAALDKQGWDESVKSLAATPSVLDMMADKLDWTQKLGDAMLAQQNDVMDGVQRLRVKAEANNKLQSTPQQKFQSGPKAASRSSSSSRQTETMYVPYYDPAVVYGAWSYRRTRLTTGAPATGRMAAQFWARAWHLARAMRLGAGPAGRRRRLLGR